MDGISHLTGRKIWLARKSWYTHSCQSASLVKSERGSQGGYRLTKAPADYTAGEILRAIEGSVAPIPCLGSETNECPMSDQCFTLPFWAGLDEVINQYIDSVTLEQLAQSLPAVKEGCGCCGTKS